MNLSHTCNGLPIVAKLRLASGDPGDPPAAAAVDAEVDPLSRRPRRWVAAAVSNRGVMKRGADALMR